MRTLFLSLLLTIAACDKEPAPQAPDMAFKSNCGFPGDTGNSLGVGKFCMSLSDCRDNNQAILCTTLGDRENFFCTFACRGDGGADQCGEEARCACSSGGCGCFPTRCDK